MAEERRCCRCVHCDEYPGSNWGWYCNYCRKIVRGDAHCDYFKPKYKY